MKKPSRSKKVTVHLTEAEFEALSKLADNEVRTLSEQIRYFIKGCLPAFATDSAVTLLKNTYHADLTKAQIDDLRQTMRQQGKIPAIKSLRELTGLGLKESKDFVESQEFGVQPTPVYPLPGQFS